MVSAEEDLVTDISMGEPGVPGGEGGAIQTI
jgi:hypothetical protein